MNNKKRLQELAGILRESEEKSEVEKEGFIVIEFENDLEVNSDTAELFQDLEDPQEDNSEK